MARLEVKLELAPEEGEHDVTTGELRAWLAELARAGDDGSHVVEYRPRAGPWRRLGRVRAVGWSGDRVGLPDPPQGEDWDVRVLPPAEDGTALPAGSYDPYQYGGEEDRDVVLPGHGADTAPVVLPSPRHAARG